MKEIIITLKISNPETVHDYKDIHDDIIFDDLSKGCLLEECELVSVIRTEKQPKEGK